MDASENVPVQSSRHAVEDKLLEGLASDPMPMTSAEWATIRKAVAQRHADIEQELLDGLNSGEPIEVTDGYWEQKLKRLDSQGM